MNIAQARRLLVATIFLVLPSTAARAALRGSGGSVSFVATGPAGLRIEGKTSELTVSESGTDVLITVALANLDTGIGLRNRHMRDKYLEVQKYPLAVLVVPRASLHFPDDGREGGGSANGTMTIHGKSKAVAFTYTAHRDHDTFDVTGSVHLDIRDYEIVVPSYLGITVKPDVDVTARFVARDL